jgi:hypothetical protein
MILEPKEDNLIHQLVGAASWIPHDIKRLKRCIFHVFILELLWWLVGVGPPENPHPGEGPAAGPHQDHEDPRGNILSPAKN